MEREVGSDFGWIHPVPRKYSNPLVPTILDTSKLGIVRFTRSTKGRQAFSPLFRPQ